MNSEEFREFYQEYFEFSKRIAAGVVKNRSTAEDISQEVFCYFYKIKEKLDNTNERKLHALVVVESTNKARDYLRKAHVKREVSPLDEVTERVRVEKAESVEAMVIGIETCEYMSMALEKLRRKNQMNYEIFVKVKYMDIPPEMVAEEYEITKNNVNNRILRTRLWLKKELSKMYGD